MKFLLSILISFCLTPIAFAMTTYPVEVSYNDETFIINGETFKAKTYCFNINEGDSVVFLEGSASGTCVSAVFKDLNTGRECRVWCE